MNADSALVAALLAVDPSGLGGVALRCRAGPYRDEWLTLLRQLLPPGTPLRRIPVNIQDGALLGGLDLSATLQAGRPVAQPGLLAQADGGVALVAMAERLSAGTAARLASVLDNQEVATERDGLTIKCAVRLGMVALDEGCEADERIPAALLDRLAFPLVLEHRADDDEAVDWEVDEVIQARLMLPRVKASEDIVQALCGTALALGVDSLRAPLLALRAARAAAALVGLDEVDESHASMAARLVLAPRATRLPPAPAQEEGQPQEPAPEPASEPESPQAPQPSANQDELPSTEEPPEAEEALEAEDPGPLSAQELEDIILAAAQAAIAPGLLAALKVGQAARTRSQTAGRAGAIIKSQTRGRPIGARRGEPRAGVRLNVIETLRAAAPWQKLRTAQSASTRRIHVRREDFHVSRFKQVGQTTTIFVVDASGSSAINRLAEAKGAVELLLADCYVRRDRVAVLAFRGKGAELLLPATRSLARAKRSLAALPGGGGTPLASGLDSAREMSEQISRKGETPIIVLLTDGRANIARDGAPGRQRAHEDALAAAQQIRLAGMTALLLDTSPQPQASAQTLAAAMGAAYLPLPYAGSQLLSQAVRAASANGAASR
jgi:magnesium chelatase subunit D